ncbi:MAG: GNAT family N-acetyltransferase [Terrimicrobiaceae bacterium]
MPQIEVSVKDCGVDEESDRLVGGQEKMDSFSRFGKYFLRVIQGLRIYRTIMQYFVKPGITIRETTDADKPAVHRLLRPNSSSTQTQPQPQHWNPNVTDWVALWRGHFAGVVQLIRHPPKHAPYVGYWLFSLHIRSLCQGCGIGRMLTQKVIDRAVEEGAPTLDLLVFEDNYKAIDLYSDLGFKMHTIPELEAGLEKDLTLSQHRRVVMRKELRKLS